MPISPKLRRSVFDRDGNKCVACGDINNLTIQHRVSKGMGGSKQFDTIAHLLTLCLLCNGRLESDAEFAEMGIAYGWKIRRNTKPLPDPTKTAVRYSDGWYLLDQQGNKTQIGYITTIKEK